MSAANRHLPKFACCQSSSSHKQTDSCSIGVSGAHDRPAVGFMPLDRIPSYPKKTNDFCYDQESPWKAEPWWRTTDVDDLASLVARKSMDFVENCDLPPPQKMHVQCAIPSAVLNNVQCASNTLSSTIQKDFMEQVTESSPSPTKAQLLEALCHSQTRAREAEKAAKQVDVEKERIIELIFKQASQISAYKQWFKMLQLDALYLPTKNNEQPVSTLFPLLLPWTSYKSHKSWKRLTGKGRRGKWSQPRLSIMKHAVSFALGLSLVGTGLLLGWTVGWMLPF
ncbi:hypothetical protein GQ457_02G001260 [Hibiscus cannabinus]